MLWKRESNTAKTTLTLQLWWFQQSLLNPHSLPRNRCTTANEIVECVYLLPHLTLHHITLFYFELLGCVHCFSFHALGACIKRKRNKMFTEMSAFFFNILDLTCMFANNVLLLKIFRINIYRSAWHGQMLIPKVLLWLFERFFLCAQGIFVVIGRNWNGFLWWGSWVSDLFVRHRHSWVRIVSRPEGLWNMSDGISDCLSNNSFSLSWKGAVLSSKSCSITPFWHSAIEWSHNRQLCLIMLACFLSGRPYTSVKSHFLKKEGNHVYFKARCTLVENRRT